MGRMIHKRPGTLAHEKALRKSASRQARSMMRMAAEPMDETMQQRLKDCLARYAANKPEERGAEVYAMVEKAYKRRHAMLNDFAEESVHLNRQWTGIMKGETGRIIAKCIHGSGAERSEVKRLRNNLETLKNSMGAFLEKLRIARKMNPKQKGQGYDKMERQIKERIHAAAKSAKAIDTAIGESEQK